MDKCSECNIWCDDATIPALVAAAACIVFLIIVVIVICIKRRSPLRPKEMKGRSLSRNSKYSDRKRKTPPPQYFMATDVSFTEAVKGVSDCPLAQQMTLPSEDPRRSVGDERRNSTKVAKSEGSMSKTSRRREDYYLAGPILNGQPSLTESVRESSECHVVINTNNRSDNDRDELIMVENDLYVSWRKVKDRFGPR